MLSVWIKFRNQVVYQFPPPLGHVISCVTDDMARVPASDSSCQSH